MYASPMTLKDGSAANVTMVKLSSDAQSSRWINSATTLSAPSSLQISHTMSTAPDGSDRHLVKLAKTVLDSNLRPRTVVLNCTLSVPRVGVTRADVNDVTAELKEFLVTANVDALLRGEV